MADPNPPVRPAGVLLFAGIVGFFSLFIFGIDHEAMQARKAAERVERAAAPPPPPWASSETACHAAVRPHAKYPSKVKMGRWETFRWTGTPFPDVTTTVYITIGRAELLNDFGAMIPHLWRCFATEGQVLKFDMVPG